MMHDAVSACHPDAAFDPHVALIVSADTSPKTPEFEPSFDYGGGEGPAPLVVAARQWASATLGRIVTDPYSWMQAVHWVHGAGLHKRFNTTTVRLAQVLAELSPCRPGVEYLMRRLKASERTVQYHLAALRETGLLVYVSRGTRRRGHLPQASVFARTIPLSFDVALGIRCTQEGPSRRVVGIAEHGRKLIAKLGRKASRKVRAPRSKKAPAAGVRCTPMEGGSVVASDTRSPTSVPLETSGRGSEQPTGEIGKGRPQGRLNKVGRRFRLAAELRARILWLGRTQVARIAWVVAEVADAGWTAEEVEAWLALMPSPERISRPSGFLARRLAGATVVWGDPAARAAACEKTADADIAAQERHEESANGFRRSTDHGVMSAVMAGMREGTALLSARCRAAGLDDLTGLPAQPVDDWDTGTAALVAMFGEQVRTVLATARPEGA